MFEGTELLSYALFLFLAYIYLPYTFFKFGAERSIDLGKRRDFTQLEEVISAFVPTSVLHAMTVPIYIAVTWGKYEIDFSVMASMFGTNRGAVSDYIYAGNWWGCLIYFIVLWPFAFFNGFLYGRAVREAARDPRAVHGIEAVWGKKDNHVPRHLKPAWWIWYPFFHESTVPLFTWAWSSPVVRVQTINQHVYDGRFIRYEKTTDGQLDAIRLAAVCRQDLENPTIAGGSSSTELGTLFIKWSQISHMIVISGDDTDAKHRIIRNRKFKDWVDLNERLEKANREPHS